MRDFWWLVIGFLLRTLFRAFALELARAWYHLTFRIVSVGVGRQARVLWEDEVFGDLELEIWEGLKDPSLSRQDVAIRVLQRSTDLLWDGWTQRGAHIAEAERARAAPARVEDQPAGRDATADKVAAYRTFVFATVSYLVLTLASGILVTLAMTPGFLGPFSVASAVGLGVLVPATSFVVVFGLWAFGRERRRRRRS